VLLWIELKNLSEEAAMSKYETHYYRNGDLDIRMSEWDCDLSQRHREWGPELFCNDLDCILAQKSLCECQGMVMIESYNHRAYGLIEYKHEAGMEYMERYRFQWRVFAGMADQCEIPAFCCFYRRKDYAMFVIPLNEHAKEWVEEPKWMSERYWVQHLYAFRDLEPSPETLALLNTTRPKNIKAA